MIMVNPMTVFGNDETSVEEELMELGEDEIAEDDEEEDEDEEAF
jgi:hypothetical protein